LKFAKKGEGKEARGEERRNRGKRTYDTKRAEPSHTGLPAIKKKKLSEEYSIGSKGRMYSVTKR